VADFYDPLLENHWSPAQVRVFVANDWVDDAKMVRYQVTDNKAPKFGFFDRTYRAIAQGRTLVQGQLWINFRFNGYLVAAIANTIARRRDFLEATDQANKYKAKIGSSINDVFKLKEAACIEAISQYVANAPPSVREKRLDEIKDYLWHKQPKDAAGEDAPNRKVFLRPGVVTKGFDIKITMGGNPGKELTPRLTKVIEDVHILGESFVANIEVPDGSRPLCEVYDFVARDIHAGTA